MIKKLEKILEVLHRNSTQKIVEVNNKILSKERKYFEIIMTKKCLCQKKFQDITVH